MVSSSVLAAAAVAYFASFAQAWLPGHKIRGVNTGSMFVFEPWMDSAEWSRMGCGGQRSEFDCVLALGQDRANSAFQNHYETWLTTADLDEMRSYGLNTIRIPLGYWMKEDLIDSSERFPRGGLERLTRFVGAASDRGFYIILDLHSGPGAQVANQAFTGQFAPSAGFYNDYNYGRAVNFLSWLTEIKHTRNEFRNVGMIEVINEPLSWNEAVQSLRQNFYPAAYAAIRATERRLGVTANNYVHVQMMSSLWGSGNPTEFMSDTYFTAFDNHRYLKWDTSVPVNKQSYISRSCGDDQRAEQNLIVGEWSLSVPDNVEWNNDWNPNNDPDFTGGGLLRRCRLMSGRLRDGSFGLGRRTWVTRDGLTEMLPELVSSLVISTLRLTTASARWTEGCACPWAQSIFNSRNKYILSGLDKYILLMRFCPTR